MQLLCNRADEKKPAILFHKGLHSTGLCGIMIIQYLMQVGVQPLRKTQALPFSMQHTCQRMLTQGTILLHILNIIRHLQKKAVSNTEKCFFFSELSIHQVAVSQNRGSSLVYGYPSYFRFAKPAVLLHRQHLPLLYAQQCLIYSGKLMARISILNHANKGIHLVI